MDAELIKWLKADFEKLENNLKLLDKKVESKINAVEEKVDRLLEFKYKVIGGTILASLLLTSIFQIVLAWLQKG